MIPKETDVVFMVNVNVFWTRPQSYYDDAPWRGRWDMDGGAFMNQASHYVDMVDWLVGPVDNVHAYTATLARDIEAEDTGVMSLRLRSGALASVNVTMLTHKKNFEGSITLLGERGTVRVGGVAVNVSTVLSALKNDALTAGLGFFGESRYLCNQLNLSLGNVPHWDGTGFAPVRVTTVAGRDRIDVLQANRVEAGANVRLALSTVGDKAALRTFLPAAVGDAVLLSPDTTGTPCLVRSVTAVTPSTGGAMPARRDASTRARRTGISSGSSASQAMPASA